MMAGNIRRKAQLSLKGEKVNLGKSTFGPSYTAHALK
jgi:hypothetical protein